MRCSCNKIYFSYINRCSCNKIAIFFIYGNIASYQKHINLSVTKHHFVFRFEEENLTRLSLSKKEKAAMRTSYTAGTLHGDLLAFSDVAVLDGSAQDGGNKKRKRQSAAKQGKKKGEDSKELMCDRDGSI